MDGLTLTIRTEVAEPDVPGITKSQEQRKEPPLSSGAIPDEIVLGKQLRLSPAATSRLKSEAAGIRAKSSEIGCVNDTCLVSPVAQSIRTAHEEVLTTLRDAHYVALASFADEVLGRAESPLFANRQEFLSRQQLVQYLSKVSDAIESLTEPKTATLILRLRIVPIAATLRLWPIRYPDGGKPALASGVTITLFRGKYHYEVRDANLLLLNDELNLVDAKGEELVCGSEPRPLPCAVK
jgi:hypothetical protein